MRMCSSTSMCVCVCVCVCACARGRARVSTSVYCTKAYLAGQHEPVGVHARLGLLGARSCEPPLGPAEPHAAAPRRAVDGRRVRAHARAGGGEDGRGERHRCWRCDGARGALRSAATKCERAVAVRKLRPWAPFCRGRTPHTGPRGSAAAALGLHRREGTLRGRGVARRYSHEPLSHTPVHVPSDGSTEMCCLTRVGQPAQHAHADTEKIRLTWRLAALQCPARPTYDTVQPHRWRRGRGGRGGRCAARRRQQAGAHAGGYAWSRRSEALILGHLA